MRYATFHDAWQLYAKGIYVLGFALALLLYGLPAKGV
jgi:hypothetical protein